jgi:hypothetical protein
MRMGIWAVLGLGMLGFCGCGDGLPTGDGHTPLHGGIVIPFPDKNGLIELLNGEGKRTAATFEPTVVAYFLQSDGKTALAILPAEVVVKLDTAQGQKTITLKPKPETSDPVGSGRFVSDPGPYDLTQRGGEISLNVGGKSLSTPFRGPR